MVAIVDPAEACEVAKAFAHLHRNEDRATRMCDTVGPDEVVASIIVVGPSFVCVTHSFLDNIFKLPEIHVLAHVSGLSVSL